MNAEKRCKQLKQLKGQRSSLNTYLQTLHDYFYIEAQDINKTYHPGSELNFEYLFDSISLNVANVLPAGIANYLTPLTGHWMTLRHHDKKINDSKRVKIWYKNTEDEIFFALASSNFYDQIVSFYKSSSIYGTSAIYVEDDHQDVFRFYNLPIKQVYISEDARQRVNEYFIEFEYTAEQASDRFGFDACSDAIKELLKNGDRSEKKFPFFLYIGPRTDRNPFKVDNANMPIAAEWYDVTEQKLVMESGYIQMPAFCHRFYKRDDMAYGFSPAMNALMDVRYANTMAQTELIAQMRNASPAYAVPNDTFMRPLNFNPDAINVYDSAAITRDRIFPLGIDGNIQVNEAMLEKRYQAIKDHMFYDVFLAFQGITKQMTIPEVMQRAQERMTILGPAVGRFLAVHEQIISIVLEKMFRADRLPELPPELQDNPNYEVEFTSTLALAQRNTDLQALDNANMRIANLAQYKPEALDKINTDRQVDSIVEMTGADPSAFNDSEQAMAIRAARMEQEQQMMAMQASAVEAKTAKDATAAEKNIKQARKPA